MLKVKQSTLRHFSDSTNEAAPPKMAPRRRSTLLPGSALHDSMKNSVTGAGGNSSTRFAMMFFLCAASFCAFHFLRTPIANVRKTLLGDLAEDSFGAFSTLMSLSYATVLGQMFDYYFDRQGNIQDCLFKEVAALQHLVALVAHQLSAQPDLPAQSRDRVFGALDAYTEMMLTSEMTEETLSIMDYRCAHIYDLPNAFQENEEERFQPASGADLHRHGTIGQMHRLLDEMTGMRAMRISQVAARLPSVQHFLLRFLGLSLVCAFTFLREVKPSFALTESIMTGTIVAVTILLEWIVDDLASPFAGFWNVGAAESALKELQATIQRLRTSRESSSLRGSGARFGAVGRRSRPGSRTKG